jgi:hypothetical protein
MITNSSPPCGDGRVISVDEDGALAAIVRKSGSGSVT